MSQDEFNFSAPVPPPASPKAKAEAMKQVEAHADPTWLERAYEALKAVATRQQEVTTDDVWDELRSTQENINPHEMRAVGPVMNRAKRDGIIQATDRIRQSKLGGGRWKVRVWESRIKA